MSEVEAAPAVVVVGMHRSGTSALSQALVEAGLDGPPEAFHVAASASNPDGHFEDVRVVAADDWLLRRHGGSAADPWVLRGVTPVAEELDHFRATWAEVATGRPLVVKDPRLCVTLPWWQAVWGPGVTYVLMVRHPAQVVASMHARESLGLVHAELLWHEYVVSALEHTAGCRRTIVRYDELLAMPREVIARIEALMPIGMPVPRPAQGWSGGVDRRHAHQRQDGDPQLERNRRLWSALSAVRPGELDDLAPFERLDHDDVVVAQDLVRQFAAWKATVVERDTERQRGDDALAAVLASRTWRYTAAPRRAWSMARRVTVRRTRRAGG